MGIKESYSGVVQFEVDSVVDGDTGKTPSTPIEFEYPNPAISIDTGGNFVVHDIIGGATVRQRIGDQPLEIGITGVCIEETAKQLELLRNVEFATLLSDRFPQDSVTVHVISVSTDPMESGGSADLKSGEFLYSFTLECVEVTVGPE